MCVCCGVCSCVCVRVRVRPLRRANNKQWLWPSIPVLPLSLHCLVLPRSFRVLGKQTLHQRWCGATVNSSNHILLRLLLEELVRWYRWPRLHSASVPAPFSLTLSRYVTSMTSAIANHILRPIAPHFFLKVKGKTGTFWSLLGRTRKYNICKLIESTGLFRSQRFKMGATSFQKLCSGLIQTYLNPWFRYCTAHKNILFVKLSCYILICSNTLFLKCLGALCCIYVDNSSFCRTSTGLIFLEVFGSVRDSSCLAVYL